MKYDELIKKLRGCVGFRCRDCELKNEEFCNPILMEQAADAIEELLKPKWIPITEKSPIEGQKVLCVGMHGESMFTGKYTGKYIDRYGKYKNKIIAGLQGWRTFTYWMPLPEPPKDGE